MGCGLRATDWTSRDRKPTSSRTIWVRAGDGHGRARTMLSPLMWLSILDLNNALQRELKELSAIIQAITLYYANDDSLS